jgi:hypothetical protein
MKLIKVLIVLIFLNGCASTYPLGPMPKKHEDYLLSMSELRKKYPDIAIYEKEGRSPFDNHPLEGNLVEVLGEPTKIETLWGTPITGVVTLLALNAQLLTWGIVIAIHPDAPQKYYFDRGKYCIEARIFRFPFTMYSKAMNSWKWSEDKDKCH